MAADIATASLSCLPSALAPLTERPRWVVWRWETNSQGKPTKVPYQPDHPGRHARSNDPGSWGSQQTASAVAGAGHADGIGYMLMDDDIAAFDIDDCRDPCSGVIDPWAWTLIDQAGSYAEVTVSGTGVRIIGRASGAHVHRKQPWPDSAAGSVETYRRASRYIVITGQELEGACPDLADIDATIDDVVARLDAAKTARAQARRLGADGPGERADDEARLPEALVELIRDGAPEGQRSDRFHHVVCRLDELGWASDAIEGLLARYPDGIASKYRGRLRGEIERCQRNAGTTHGAAGGQATSYPVAARICATAFTWIDPKAIPRRQWLYGRHLIRKFLSCTIAPGAVGKSSLALVEAIAMASGRILLDVPVSEPLRVWYWNGEDPREELQRRIAAICIHYDLSSRDLDGRLFVDSGRETEIVIAQRSREAVQIAHPVVTQLKATIAANAIDVMVIDPFVSSHRVVENDNGDMEVVATQWAQIADATGCAVELIHHARKTGGMEVTVEHGRGAVALINKSRSVRTLNTMTREEADKAGLASHRGYFRVDNGKANLAPPPDASSWYRLQSVPLGNGDPDNMIDDGDQVAVVTTWQWPDPLAEVTVDDLRAAQAAVAQGGPWRENIQARDWVGYPIGQALKLDMSKVADKAKVRSLLKIWLQSRMFVVVERTDDKRNKRMFVEVGELATD